MTDSVRRPGRRTAAEVVGLVRAGDDRIEGAAVDGRRR